jgi:hypothetical protein
MFAGAGSTRTARDSERADLKAMAPAIALTPMAATIVAMASR